MLTEEQQKEINEAVKAALEAAGALAPVSKVQHGNAGDGEPVTKVSVRQLEDPKGGFKSPGHFFTDVIRLDTNTGPSETMKTWNEVVKTAGYMEEGDMSQGGYLVPVEFSRKIFEKSLEKSIVRPRAAIQPMTSNRIVIPADVDDDHATDYFGGIVIYRPGEGATKTAKNPVFAQIALTLHKLTGLVYVSDELLSDSVIALEAHLTRKFSQAIAFVEDDDFLNGDGSNKALGAFHASNPCRISVAKETGQAATTIVSENILKMWQRLYPAGHGNAVWVANIDTFVQLATMSLAVGTGGIPMWMPAGGLAGLPYQTLMGRPLLFTEKMQTLGTVGDIGLVDFSQYIIGQKGSGEPTMATSMHVRFVYDEQAFRFVLRYDGQPTWTSALTPKRSAETLSPFVVLATR